MNREKIWEFLEAYRDGVIDDNAAAELAHVILDGGKDADWILEELTFSGWIQQALEQLDEVSFVRSFLERLHAEQGGDEFTRAFSQRLAVETQKIKKQEDEESRLNMPFRKFLGSRTDARPGDAGISSKSRIPVSRSRVVLACVCIIIIISGLGYLLTCSRPSAFAGTFIEASAGVVVLSEEEQRDIVPGEEICADESVTVPLNGHAVINDFGNGRWRLHGGAKATFMPERVATGHLSFPDAEGIFLQAGVIAGEITQHGQGLMYVTTPHATAEFNDPVSFTLSVTAGATYAEVDSGTLVITRKSDGRTLELQQGCYAVAADGGDFEALEK